LHCIHPFLHFNCLQIVGFLIDRSLLVLRACDFSRLASSLWLQVIRAWGWLPQNADSVSGTKRWNI